jgi:acyl-coenzyme A thioesterase PaaI-like protein
MLFSETLATIRPAGKGFTLEVGEDWSQGRAVFGGLVGAIGNEVMRRIVPADRPLRGLEIAFVGPMLPGPVRAETEILRTGKSATLASARLFCGNDVVATLTGAYGLGRKVAITLSPEAPSGVAAVGSLPDRAPPQGVNTPTFLKHFRTRFAHGSIPYAKLDHASSKVYVRHCDPAPLTESHVVALIDCIPPPVLQMMTVFTPASSLMWTLEFLRHDYDFPPDAFWRIDTDVKGAAEGYSQESSLVLDPNGVPCAFSRQLVAVFG